MVIKYLLQATKGKILWNKLEKKYGKAIFPTRFVLFPSQDNEYNAWGLYYLSKYLKDNNFDKTVVITANKKVVDGCSNIAHENLHIEFLNQKKLDYIIRFTGLVPLKESCTIVSVKEPYDTGAERLLGKKGVTKKEIVWYDVYKNSETPETAEKIDISAWNIPNEFKSVLKAGEIL